MSGAQEACDLLPPHGLLYARLYVGGWRCDRHTPNAIKGLPEIPPGPGWPPGAYLYQTEPSTPLEEKEQHDDDSARPRPPAESG